MTAGHYVKGALGIALLLALPASVHVLRAQGAPQRGRFFASYYVKKRVTITRHGMLVTTLEIPGGMQPDPGVYLSVYNSPRQPSVNQAGRSEFHGDVEIRMRPRSDVQSGESNNSETVMEKAPVVLTANDVDVVVEQIPR